VWAKKLRNPLHSFIHPVRNRTELSRREHVCVCLWGGKKEKENLKFRKWSFEENKEGRKEGRKFRGKNQTQNFNNEIEWGNGFVFL
jgi:hypothetical protein